MLIFLIAQLISWIVFLLSGVVGVMAFLRILHITDGLAFAILIVYAMTISLAGIFISALAALTVRSIAYQPSHNEMTAFDRSLKFVAAAGWGIFFVLVPLVLVVLGEDWFGILPLLWIAYTILCDVLLIISKAKEKKRQKRSQVQNPR